MDQWSLRIFLVMRENMLIVKLICLFLFFLVLYPICVMEKSNKGNGQD